MPAPYSDNLYSGDGDASDDDQHDDDVLSPTDGYFHASSASHRERLASNVPSVPNVLVEDPSLQQDGAAAKAREADEERLMINTNSVGHPSRSVPRPVSYSQSHQPGISIPAALTTSTPYQRRSVDEQQGSFASSSHQPGDAPPAYSPSPLSPPPVSGYQTFTACDFAAHPAPMGLSEEHQALLAHHPQSMGGGGSPNHSGPSMWRRLADPTSSNTRRKIKTLLGVLAIASVFFALFGIGPSLRAPDIIDNSPVKRPQTSPRHDMEWRTSPDCLNTPYEAVKTIEHLVFGTDRNLAVTHMVANDDGNRRGTPVHVSGDIILRPVDASSAGTIQFEIISNYQNQKVRVEFNRRKQEFVIITPRSIDWPQSRPGPCLQLRATVLIPRESHLRSFRVESTLLDIQVEDGLVLTSSISSSLNAVSGRIHTGRVSGELAPYTLASRTIEIETASGSVDGWFPLYDVLSITTVSGNVNADVTPKSSADKEPEQAVLSVSSVSGNVRIREPLDQVNASDSNFPSRDFVVDVKTASGQVAVDLAFTSSAKFESQSGDFRLRLLPLFHSSYSSRSKPVLMTDTKSGGTKLTVLEPVWTDSAASAVHYSDKDHGLSFLESQHSSVSGDFELAYPESWEGKLSMVTISGGQSIHGEGLRVTHSGAVLKKIQGTKGDGHSQLMVKSTSGDEDVYIGGRDGRKH